MNKIAAVFLIFFIFSCAQVEKSPEPKNLFSKEKMAAVITDLYLIEGAISSNKKAFTKTGIEPSSFLYTKHDMDSVSFEKNLNYYVDRLEDYAIIMSQVEIKLKVIQDSINAKQERINKEKNNDIPKNTLQESEKNKIKLDSLKTTNYFLNK